MKQLVLNQAMEIYKLGIEMEIERRKLTVCMEQYGMLSPFTQKQSQKLDKLICKFTELESRHIATTEQYIQRRVVN